MKVDRVRFLPGQSQPTDMYRDSPSPVPVSPPCGPWWSFSWPVSSRRSERHAPFVAPYPLDGSPLLCFTRTLLYYPPKNQLASTFFPLGYPAFDVDVRVLRHRLSEANYASD